MSTTALVWLTAYVTGGVLAFVNPAYGLYAYFLDYYAHPPLRWWGKDLPGFRWSLTIALVTAGAYALKRITLPEIKPGGNPQTKWLIMFLLTAVLVQPVALWPEKSWESLVELIKRAVLYGLIIKAVRTKTDFRYLVLIQILGIFYWGWNAFSDPKRIAGRLVNIGGPDSLDDNAAAAHVLAILPFVGVVLLTGRRWEKLVALAVAPFALNLIVLCNSRGAFLALIVVALVAVLAVKSGQRWKVTLGAAAAGVLFYSLLDPQFITRQQTILSYGEDTSATGRLVSWRASLSLIRDHPFGTGGGGYDFLSPTYIPEIVEARGGGYRTVHNSYLLVASEWGILGFIFFVGFIGSTLLQLDRLRTIRPETPEENRLWLEGLAVTLGLVGTLVAGMFTNRSYAEPLYWFPALAAVLTNLWARERGAEGGPR